MKKLLLIPVVLAILLLAAVLILPGLVPSSVYKDRISETVSNSLGRDVTIDGDVKVSVLPTLQAKAAGVTIANPKGFTGEPFVQMGELRAKVKLLPLLSKRVEIDEFILVEPSITLIKTKSGETNWAMGSGEAAEVAAPNDEDGFRRTKGFGDVKAAIGEFSIIDGKVSYADAVSGASHTLTNVDLNISLPALDAPVSADGNLTLDGTPMDIALSLDTPEAFMSGQAAPFRVDLKSELATVQAKGEFLQSESIALTANVDADIPAIDKIISLIDMDIPYANLAQTLSAKGDIRFDGKNASARGADVKIAGPLFNADYTGDFSTQSGASFSGDLKANVSDLPALLAAIEQDIPQAAAVKTANISAKVSGTPEAITVKDINLTADGETLNATYNGGITTGETPTLSGAFTATVKDPVALGAILELDQPALSALSGITAKGQVSGPVSALSISDIIASLTGEGLAADFTGGFTGGETASANGAFTVDVANLSALSTKAGLDIPYADIAGGLNAKGAISGPVKSLAITDINAALKDGLLKAKFENASATLGEALSLSGRMEVSTDSVRALAAKTGTTLPDTPNTFGPFSLSGDVSGTPQSIKFGSANLRFDDIRGTGAFGIDLTGAKPNLTGQLDLDGLDVAPYMAKGTSQKKSGGIAPWSETPLDLAPLRAANANLTLTTPNIKTDRLTLGQSRIEAVLSGGKLTAKIPSAQLYSGTGDVTLVLDGSTDVARTTLDVALSSLNTPEFLGASAGFDKLTGNTTTVLSLSGQGSTQAALMKSLSGNGNFDLSNGAIMGVDLGQFLGGIEQAWTSRSLPAGIGPGQKTAFSELLGKFEINNGVVSVKDFGLSANGVAADAAGTLDLGNQKIDFSLRPRLVDENGNPKGNGLAGFGIPLRFQGDFGGVSAGLDTDMLGKIVEQRAKAEAAKAVNDAIKDNVSGPLGDLLGGVLGGQQSQTPTPPPANETTPEASPATPTEAQQPEPEKPEPEKEEEKTDEEKAVDLLKGIFGGD